MGERVDGGDAYHSAESVPWLNRSMRFLVQETAAGVVCSTPPRDSQPPQCAPSHQRCLCSAQRQRTGYKVLDH